MNLLHMSSAELEKSLAATDDDDEETKEKIRKANTLTTHPWAVGMRFLYLAAGMRWATHR